MDLLADHPKGLFDIPRGCLEGVGINGERGAQHHERGPM